MKSVGREGSEGAAAADEADVDAVAVVETFAGAEASPEGGAVEEDEAIMTVQERDCIIKLLASS